VIKSDEPFPLTKCGSTTFKSRADLYLTATNEGAKRIVRGEGDAQSNYGSQVGWSYDWQKCSK
jgi:hypothetical protein